MATIMRSVDGMQAGKKYIKCPVCNGPMAKISGYTLLEMDQEEICTKCNTVYHKECGSKTECCLLWRCKQCAEMCNQNKHYQCQLNCDQIYCSCK